MLYSIVTEDIPNSLEKRLEKRADHRQRLVDLQNAGKLIMAGPNPAVDSNDPGSAGYTGSLIVAEFASLEEAEAWAQTDPYCENGVYNNVAVKPFVKVF